MCHVQEWDDELNKKKRIPKPDSYDFWLKAINTLHNVRRGRILLTCYPSNGGRPSIQNHVSDEDAQYHITFSNNKTNVQPRSKTTTSNLAISPSRRSLRHVLNLTDSLKENIHFDEITSGETRSSRLSVSFHCILYITVPIGTCHPHLSNENCLNLNLLPTSLPTRICCPHLPIQNPPNLNLSPTSLQQQPS
jgi:hypothetical protein